MIKVWLAVNLIKTKIQMKKKFNMEKPFIFSAIIIHLEKV